MLKIICVLKSGGVYNSKYVENLIEGINRSLTGIDFEFICLSDTSSDKYTILPLTTNHSGWWAKIETFKIPGPVIYFDLDTVILNGIDVLAHRLLTETNTVLYLLKPFRKKEGWATGIMAWTGSWSWLFDEFSEADILTYRGDQNYVSDKIAHRKTKLNIEPIQSIVSGIYSYKLHCRTNPTGLPPEGANIVCFHGNPRPADIGRPYFND